MFDPTQPISNENLNLEEPIDSSLESLALHAIRNKKYRQAIFHLERLIHNPHYETVIFNEHEYRILRQRDEHVDLHSIENGHVVHDVHIKYLT